MSKNEVTITGDALYDDAVHAACELTVAANKELLVYYWKLGETVKKATGGEKDGPRSVPQFLQHMNQVAPGKISLGKHSLYNALDLFDKLSKKQIETAQESGMALRNLLPLCTDKVSPEEREDAIERIASGEIPQTATQSLALGQNKTKTKDNATDAKRAATIKVTRMSKYLEKAHEKLLGYAEAMDVVCADVFEDAEIEKIQQAYRETVEQVENITTRWDHERKAALKVIEKTITMLDKAERQGK